MNSHDGAPETVLIVDDNPTNLQIMQAMLVRQGYHCQLAYTGEEALEMTYTSQPSLILLDIVLPGIDGYEVCEQLKDNALSKDIPVIFLSAMEDSQAKVKGFSLGAVDFISKPFQPAEAVARVNTHMKIRRLEKQLAQRNVELEVENQRILNAVNEGIIGLDAAGCITTINPAATRIIGFSADFCRGKHLFTMGVFHADERAFEQESETLPYRSYHLGEAAFNDFQLIRRSDGELLPVALSSIPYDEGGAVLVLRDISEWVENEEALRSAREQLEIQRQQLAHIERLNTTGEMAACIAHEVNQPLTAVTNYASVCKHILAGESIDLARLHDVLSRLDSQAVRASQVIERLRQFVRKPESKRVVVQAEKLVNDVIALSEIDTRINDITIHFQPLSPELLIEIDTVQLEQVILNLIRNAIDSMAASELRAQGVVIEVEEVAGGMACFRVIDCGEGIPPEVERDLFTPFHTTKKNGMGVGLSICKSIIEAHGGQIGHSHNPEGGTTFYFNLPLVSLQ